MTPEQLAQLFDKIRQLTPSVWRLANTQLVVVVITLSVLALVTLWIAWFFNSEKNKHEKRWKMLRESEELDWAMTCERYAVIFAILGVVTLAAVSILATNWNYFVLKFALRLIP